MDNNAQYWADKARVYSRKATICAVISVALSIVAIILVFA